MVPATLVSRSGVGDVGKELSWVGLVVFVPFKDGLTNSTTGKLPSMHVRSGNTSGTTIVLTCSSQYPSLLRLEHVIRLRLG